MNSKYTCKYNDIFKELLEKRSEERVIELSKNNEFKKFIDEINEHIKNVYCPVIEVKDLKIKDDALSVNIQIESAILRKYKNEVI